ncbi:MAG: phosphoribosyltransferase [Pseudomonadota bacterium]
MREGFRDRVEAGRQLAGAVRELFDANPAMDDPVVLALPRGGVPVALEVARDLRAPLDLVLVRKIGVPWNPELAAAAVVDGDHPLRVVNEDVMRMAGVSQADLEAGETRALEEIDRRRKLWLGGRARAPLAGRDLVVVDDGIATGATMRVALQAMRAAGPRSLIAATPVGADDALDLVRGEVDHVICLLTPVALGGIGAWYADFAQLEDSDVQRLLSEADAIAPPGDAPYD